MSGAAMDVDSEGQLTLSALLHPKEWKLPGWNDSNFPPQAKHSNETLAQLDHSLALLSRYRNSLRPHNRLTPDILVIIFQVLADEHSWPTDSGFGAYPWKGIAQVCHFWREVTLSSAILWTQLSTRHSTAALACVERSGEAPLSLVIHENSSNEKVSSVLKAVAPHINRLQRFFLPINWLKATDGNIHHLLQPILSSPAPMLETLVTPKIRDDSPWIPLPTLFTGHTPNLTHLDICFLRPELRSLSFGRLKTLSFRGRKRAPITMSVSALLDLLEASPNLEVLKTVKVTFSPADEDDTRKVTLDCLKLLEIGREKASVVAEILNRIIFPNSTSFHLNVWLDRYEDNKFYIGVPSMELLNLDHTLRDIKKMQINYLNGYEAVEILAVTSNTSFSINGHLESTTVTNLGDMDAIAGTVFKSLMRSFDFEHLEEFGITEYRNNARWTGFTTQIWTQTFRSMPNLKALYVCLDGCYDEGFSRAILSALSSRDERNGRLLCPSLESLSVSGDKTWSSLQCYNMAEQRSNGGYPLKRVSMRLSHYASFSDPSDTDLPLLRRYVETVDLEAREMSLPEFPEM
ncbi:hypothetical protein C8Q75DRAFT_739100 [Abortiporus biennis]|nr:hypothetical protein C8Q75DRAFT_739100 [Abortiporus biennis]